MSLVTLNSISSNPCVTVLMPVYNGVLYLKESIESVLNQTFRDFEFLIIDDASQDGSVSLVQSYSDSRIRLVQNQENLGQVRSLNVGLKLAQGQYVARLDQDDVCLPDRFAKQVAFFEKNPGVAIVGTLAYGVDSKGQRKSVLCMRLEDYETFLAYLLLGDTPIGHPTVMFRRQPVAEVGGYDPSFAPAEDYDLWSRLVLKRLSAFVIPEPLLLYRMHGEQQSVTKETLQRKNWARAHFKLVEFFYGGQESQALSLLLRRRADFWQACSSKSEVAAIFNALNQMLLNVNARLKLTSAEFKKVKKIINKRLGLGVVWGPRIARYPSTLFYFLFFVLSPLFIPGLRPALSSLARKLRHLKFRVNV